MSAARVGAVLAAASTAALLIVLATGPPAPITLPPGSTPAVRGAFHIHTVRSDGALSKADVAAAAARAGLQFAVFTDHGDGTRPPDPPEYLHGVLCLDGVEISTNDGHYVAVDLPAAPYPLGGDGSAVAEDVRRLGGFGVAAHPSSPRQDLAWSDLSVPIDGLEWLNADTEWRDESLPRLARTTIDYFWRPGGALARLLDRPSTLDRWDELAALRPVVAIGAHDAHGGVGPEREEGTNGRWLHVPSYEASFRAFSVYADIGGTLRGDPHGDGNRLVAAIRGGEIFTTIDALASPASLNFQGTVDGITASMGGRLPPGSRPASFTVRATVPPGATTRLLRNGVTVSEAGGGVLDHEDSRDGAYRVEIIVKGHRARSEVPWVLSNPIYRLRDVVQSPSPQSAELRAIPITDIQQWRIEADAGSSGSVDAAPAGVTVQYRLQPPPAASPFVAVAIPLEAEVLPGAERITFRGRADRPMRVSVQLRYAEPAGRWRHSIYLDGETRTVQVPLESLRPADVVGARRPPFEEATSLLFVVDLTNARPGDAGQFVIGDVAFQSP